MASADARTEPNHKLPGRSMHCQRTRQLAPFAAQAAVLLCLAGQAAPGQAPRRPSATTQPATLSSPTTTPAPAGRGRIRYGPGRLLASLANRKINESSGLAPSRRERGIFWTHNDSGDGANLYAFDLEGRDRGTFRVPGLRARDWEDIASFVLDRKSYLLVADVGDNGSGRSTCAIHVVHEPLLGKRTPKRGATARLHRTLTFRYQDGPVDSLVDRLRHYHAFFESAQ